MKIYSVPCIKVMDKVLELWSDPTSCETGCLFVHKPSLNLRIPSVNFDLTLMQNRMNPSNEMDPFGQWGETT